MDKSLYEQLLTLAFLEHGHKMLLRGTSGVRKTTPAQNLGLTALQHGYTVRFATLADALVDLLKQESMPTLERRMRHYTRPDLLILDELGYLLCDSSSGHLLYKCQYGASGAGGMVGAQEVQVDPSILLAQKLLSLWNAPTYHDGVSLNPSAQTTAS